MKYLVATFFLVILVTGSLAEGPMDAKVKAALYEIDRAEKQMSSAAPGQTAKLKRIERMLDSAGAALDAAANHDDGAWKSASARLTQLRSHMAALLAPPAPDPAQANQLTADDLNVLGGIDRQTDGLIRQMDEFDAADIVRLHDGLRKNVEGLKQQYRTLANPQHPQAIMVAQKILGVEQRINTAIAADAANDNALGDVEGRVAEIRQRMSPSNRTWFGSPVPDAPFTTAVVAKFSEDMSTWKTAALRDQAYLQQIDGKSGRVNTADLLNKVNQELQSIERYNKEMLTRMEKVLASADAAAENSANVSGTQIEFALTRLRHGAELVTASNEFERATGMEVGDKKSRLAAYNQAIALMQKKAAAEKDAAAATSASTKKPAPSKKPLAAQEIEVHGVGSIEITAEGEVWVNSDKLGDITADGEIWVAGDKAGDLTADGEVWKAGDKIGDITADGEVWRDGNQVGSVLGDGTIWINGSRQGWFKGGDSRTAAVIVFYGFFEP